MPTSDRISILDEAKELTERVRQSEYGPPDQVYQTAADLVNAAFDTEFDASDVMMILILIKIARERHNRKRDNLVDIAGYANCLDMVRR